MLDINKVDQMYRFSVFFGSSEGKALRTSRNCLDVSKLIQKHNQEFLHRFGNDMTQILGPGVVITTD